MVLAGATGKHRNAGQAGYPTVRLEKNVIKSLQDLFAANDAIGVETMALLYGGEQDASGEVTDIVQIEHQASVPG